MNLLKNPPVARMAIASIFLAAPGIVGGQATSSDVLRQKIRSYVSAHDVDILRELNGFVALPNLASDSVNIRRNAARLLEMLQSRGITGRLLESPAGGPPAVFGELRTPGATKTVVF